MAKKHLFILASLSCIILVISLSYLSGTSLQDYQPRNQDEQKIVELLIKFETAKQESDLTVYLSCLGENGWYMHRGHLMVRKNELAALLPAFWKGNKENNAHFKPMCRENINGNFLNGSFLDPIISITKNSAHAAITFQTPIVRWRTLLFLDFEKKNGEWLITRYEWDMG